MTTTADRLSYPAPDTRSPQRAPVFIPQYRKRGILAVWAAATVPMGVLSWVVAPRLADGFSGPVPLAKALLVCLGVGVVWQGVLVLALVAREQRSLRWPVVRDALWLRAPRSPRTGRTGGRVWWVVLPLVVVSGLGQLLPTIPYDAGRDFGRILGSPDGEAFLHGSWGWFAVIVTGFVFNTMLGEELLFRGFLLPRMQGAFGDRDWVANGVLFACYHVHVPWAIPAALLDAVVLAYPSKRFRSAWIGIAVHSAQSVFLTVAVLTLVL